MSGKGKQKDVRPKSNNLLTMQISIGKSLGVENQPGQGQVDALCKPIVDYHRSLESRDGTLLAASLCDVVYRVYCASSERFAEWEPWPQLTREQTLRNFSSAFAREDYYYENRLEFTHVKLNGTEAFVRTIETGRTWKDRRWDNVEVLWHTTRVDEGRWLIAGHIHHLT